MRSTLLLFPAVVAGLLLACLPAPTPAADEDRDLAAEVNKAIEGGKTYLRSQLSGDALDKDPIEGNEYRGGETALAVLALLNAGAEPATDAAVKKGLQHLRGITIGEGSKTYVVSLQTMVYCYLHEGNDRDNTDQQAVENNVRWLLETRRKTGWGYYKKYAGDPDNSNTQFAILALHEAKQSKFKLSEETRKDLQAALEEVQKFYIATQIANQSELDGTWIYRPGFRGSPFTMTTAGLCGLLITGMDVEEDKSGFSDEKGTSKSCGAYDHNLPVAKALKWLGDNFPADVQNMEQAVGNKVGWSSPYYCLYGIERAGRLSGRRFFEGKDWYRIGCRLLVKTKAQNADGSWSGESIGTRFDQAPPVATSFALLFLSKGRTPVLVTKFAYGQPNDEGWNHKHSDIRNLVAYTGREVFKKPMAWQIYDVRGQWPNSTAAKREAVEGLLESPIIYFNGHDGMPTDVEAELLRQYVDNGGFVFVEACCGSLKFDKQFRAWVTGVLFNGEPVKLERLGEDHPVWTAAGLEPNSRLGKFKLEGVQRGCKTVLIYSPTPMAGYWELNKQHQGAKKIEFDTENTRDAFEMGANVIAYATGLEAPRNRLDAQQIPRDDAKDKGSRGYLKVAQLIDYNNDSHPAPVAMRNLMAEVGKAGIDVELGTKQVAFTSRSLTDYRFIYMHGRGGFTVKDDDLKKLRFILDESGGLLLADACCGSQDFDASFRKMAEQLWKDHKLEPIPPEDELYSAELNGQEIKNVKRRQRSPDGKSVEREFAEVKPALEGIKIDGRWVVIYSRNDIGCALEGKLASGCLGHDHDSAVRLGRAAVLYALKH
jgi:hypothetical protein